MLLRETVYPCFLHPVGSNHVCHSLSSASAAISCRLGLNICAHQKLGTDCPTPKEKYAQSNAKGCKEATGVRQGSFGPEIVTKNWI